MSSPTSNARSGIQSSRARAFASMRARFWIPAFAGMTFGIFALLATLAFALDFPALTGRVVDQANILPPATRTQIETKLAALEDKSGIQLVVATVSSLQGSDIETFSVDLARAWMISPLGAIGCISVGVTNSAFRTLSPIYAQQIGLSVTDVAAFVSASIIGGGPHT